MKRLTILLTLGLILLSIVAEPSFAADYKENKQNEALYGVISSWYARDFSHYVYWLNELSRYGLLILQEHLDQRENEWIKRNIWIMRKAEWIKKRESQKMYVPTDTSIILLEILLEDNHMSLLNDQEILGKPLHYVDGRINIIINAIINAENYMEKGE